MTDTHVPTDVPTAGLETPVQVEDIPKPPFKWINVFGPLAVLAIVLLFWEYMHRSGLRTFFDKPGFLVPSPVTVIHDSFIESAGRSNMLTGLKWTSLAAFLGLAIAIVLGMSLALIMARASWVERSIYPYLVALQAIPVLAIVPIIYIVFGSGLVARLFVCVMISIFPIVSNTLFGLLSADQLQHDLFTLQGASRWTRLTKLQLPAAMPAIFTGFRISAGLSVIGVVVGEQFFRGGSMPGIGIIMERYRVLGRYPQIFGGLLVACALGIAVFVFFGWLSKVVVGKWHQATR
jgi:NitT/TauT family transport system permease protein